MCKTRPLWPGHPRRGRSLAEVFPVRGEVWPAGVPLPRRASGGKFRGKYANYSYHRMVKNIQKIGLAPLAHYIPLKLNRRASRSPRTPPAGWRRTCLCTCLCGGVGEKSSSDGVARRGPGEDERAEGDRVRGKHGCKHVTIDIIFLAVRYLAELTAQRRLTGPAGWPNFPESHPRLAGAVAGLPPAVFYT